MSETKTALDEIKGIESQARKLSLIEILADLKKKAKEIKKMKHYTDSILKELGYDSKEIKSIIDYINSQAYINEKDIEDDARKDLERKKDTIVEKMKNLPTMSGTWANNLVYTTTSSPATYFTTGDNTAFTCATNAVSCSTSPTVSDLELIDSL